MIGKHLVPSASHLSSIGGGSPIGSSRRWISWGDDIFRLLATCKLIHNAVRGLAWETWGFHKIEETFEQETQSALSRLRVIQEEVRKLGDSGISGRQIRHFYLRINLGSRFFQQQISQILEAINLMLNLESVAIVHAEEESVVRSSPYEVAGLPAAFVEALSRLPTLRALFLCGIKLSILPQQLSRFNDGFSALTLTACHDSTLSLLYLVPSATRITIWRDFSSSPKIEISESLLARTWSRLGELELFGFSSKKGQPLLQTLGHSLWQNPASVANLVVLSLPEAHSLSFFNDKLIPALGAMTRLRSLTLFIYHEEDLDSRSFEALSLSSPKLEELEFGVNGAELEIWPGDLCSWGLALVNLGQLKKFTWNYTSSDSISLETLSQHIEFPLTKRICSIHPSLRSVKWFSTDVEFRRSDTNEVWEWKSRNEFS
ncbi:hypothetical protein JCM5350_001916 [Sporobolomyces pararoseus]